MSTFRSGADLSLLPTFIFSLPLGLMSFYLSSVTLMGHWEGVKRDTCVQFIMLMYISVKP